MGIPREAAFITSDLWMMPRFLLLSSMSGQVASNGAGASATLGLSIVCLGPSSLSDPLGFGMVGFRCGHYGVGFLAVWRCEDVV